MHAQYSNESTKANKTKNIIDQKTHAFVLINRAARAACILRRHFTLSFHAMKQKQLLQNFYSGLSPHLLPLYPFLSFNFFQQQQTHTYDMLHSKGSLRQKDHNSYRNGVVSMSSCNPLDRQVSIDSRSTPLFLPATITTCLQVFVRDHMLKQQVFKKTSFYFVSNFSFVSQIKTATNHVIDNHMSIKISVLRRGLQIGQHCPSGV